MNEEKFQKEIEKLLKTEKTISINVIEKKLLDLGLNTRLININNVVQDSVVKLVNQVDNINEKILESTLKNIKQIEKELLIQKFTDRKIANDSIGSSSKKSSSILLDARIFNTNLRDFQSFREVAKVLNENLIGRKKGEFEKQKSNQDKLKQYRKNFLDFGFIKKNVEEIFCWTEIGLDFYNLVKNNASDFELTKMMVQAIVKNEEFDKSVLKLIQSVKRVYPNKELSDIYDELIETEEQLKTAIKERNDIGVPDIWALMLFINNDEFFEFFEFLPIDEILDIFKRNFIYVKKDGRTLGVSGILKKGETRHYSTIFASIVFAQTYLDNSKNLFESDVIKGGHVVRAGGSKTYQRDALVKEQTSILNNYKCVHCNIEGFEKKTGGKYIENHHIIPLENLPIDSRYLLDVVGNCISLCASCHKMVHHGSNISNKNIFELMFLKLDSTIKSKWSVTSIESLRNKYK